MVRFEVGCWKKDTLIGRVPYGFHILTLRVTRINGIPNTFGCYVPRAACFANVSLCGKFAAHALSLLPELPSVSSRDRLVAHVVTRACSQSGVVA
jgi:hypothetical protein